jgi:hypothetical protein
LYQTASDNRGEIPQWLKAILILQHLRPA